MTTRRELITSGLGLAAIIAAGKAPAAFIKSAIAARSGMGGKKEITAKDYVQDGLVAIWDGIENNGWGKHNPNKGNNWYDLVGNRYIRGWSWNNTCGWFDNSFCPLNRVENSNTLYIDITNGYTCETCHCYYFWDSAQHATAVNGGNGNSDDTQNVSIGGMSYGWTRNSSGFLSFKQYVSANKGSTQTATIQSTGKVDFYTKGGKIHVNIPLSSLTYNSRNVSMFCVSQTGSTSVGAKTFYCSRFYNRVLTLDEIDHNYQIDKIRFGTT